MPYDEDLAFRVRARLAGEDGVAERRMFGALTFLISGNLACGVTGDALMVRLDPEDAVTALAEPAVRPMEMGARRMKGWVLVGPAAVEDDDALHGWLARGVAFARALPPK